MLHCRYLCRNFLECLYWCAEKYPLLFIRFYMKLFPIAMVSLLCKNLILSILTLYLMLGSFLFNLDWFEQPFIFASSWVPFSKLWSEECSYKTISKNAEAAVRKCSSEAVAQRCSVKKVFSEFSQSLQENTHARVSLLIKLQAHPHPATLLKKGFWHRCFPVNFVKFLRTSFLTEHLWLLPLFLQNRCS